MDDLTAFVSARLDEDEAAARAVEDNSAPARALRDVDADRKLIAAYLAARKAVPPVDDWYELADGVKIGVADGLELAVKIRAERFSGHPDYRPEWKP